MNSSEHTKVQGQTASQAFRQTFREEFMPVLLKFPRTLQRNKHSQSFCEATITLMLIAKADRDITTRENHRTISLMNTDTKILNKILANQFHQYIKKDHIARSSGIYPRVARIF